VAEIEVVADDDVGRAEPCDQNALDEGFRGERCQLGIERLDEDQIEAELLENCKLALQSRQPELHLIRVKEFAGMRFKDHRCRGHALGSRLSLGFPNQGAMAAMNAVEVADRDGCTAMLLQHMLMAMDDVHAPRVLSISRRLEEFFAPILPLLRPGGNH
jgi:hypothetical protein